jgi:hypothetical protein
MPRNRAISVRPDLKEALLADIEEYKQLHDQDPNIDKLSFDGMIRIFRASYKQEQPTKHD